MIGLDVTKQGIHSQLLLLPYYHIVSLAGHGLVATESRKRLGKVCVVAVDVGSRRRHRQSKTTMSVAGPTFVTRRKWRRNIQ